MTKDVIQEPRHHPVARANISREQASRDNNNEEGGDQDFTLPVPMPLPARRSVARRPLAAPGAYPIQSSHLPEQPEQEQEEEQRAPEAPWDITGGISNEMTTTSQQDLNGDEEAASNDGLAVASLVSEDDIIPDNLPRAEQARDSDASTTRMMMRAEKEKTFQTRVFVGVILLIGILVILVAMLVPSNDSATSNAADATFPTPIPSQSPSLAPTTFTDHILSLLPMETVHTILQDPQSPQAKAYHWLLEDDLENLPFLSAQRIVQKFALATLYYSTEGDSWTIHDNWLDHSVHECSWFNMPSFALTHTISQWLGPGYLRDIFPKDKPARCDSHGLYQHLWLDQNNLGGVLPSRELFSLLTSLQSLSLGWNRMQGTITSEVGQLVNLTGLVISYLVGSDSGTIPSEIGRLTHLKVLALSDNNHQGELPAEVWQLTNLDTLSLSRNVQLRSTIPPSVGNLTKLRWLAMGSCGLSGTIPSEIGLATSLEWLITWHNRLQGTLPTEMKQLTRLELLELFHNSIQGTVPTALGSLGNLFAVKLQSNQLSGPLPSELGLLTNLVEELNAGNNQLTGTIPSELGHLSALKKLVLSDNRFTGEIPNQLGRLVAAQVMTFANNSFSGTVPQGFAALQNSLHTLSLEGNVMLSGSLPEGICKLNGTCIKGPFETCSDEPLGLSFDCSSLLCGCGCPCLNG